MQSGISASQELVSLFNTLLGSDVHFGLVITIASEKLKPVALLTPPSSGGSFASRLDTLLAPHIKPNESLYVLLRRYTEAPFLIAVTYVPDTAPIRQKTLFASTRATLMRDLGAEHFRDSLFATTPEELTAEGFAQHDAHNALAAPLTEAEKSLQQIKRAEQEAGSSTTATRALHMSNHVSILVTEEALEALKALANGRRLLVMMKINVEKECVELVHDDSTPSSIRQLVQTISATEPRFTLYKFVHTHEGAETSPVLFFYTCPSSPNHRIIKNRMLYPLMKKAFLQIAENVTGVQIEKRFEVEEPKEITEQSVLADLHPHAEVRKGFSRPKRPGR